MATLKISDISVGDWVGVRCGTKINAFKVEEIRFNNIIHKYVALLNNKAYGLPTTELHPIPITAEILEKNGFECIEEDVDTALYGTPSCSIFHTKGTLRYRLDTPQASVVCWNIHDLQHALRLAGIDKEINL